MCDISIHQQQFKKSRIENTDKTLSKKTLQLDLQTLYKKTFNSSTLLQHT